MSVRAIDEEKNSFWRTVHAAMTVRARIYRWALAVLISTR